MKPANSAPQTIASGNGTPSFATVTVIYAPAMMNSPWARLMTPIMPKMIASPLAHSTRKALASPNW